MNIEKMKLPVMILVIGLIVAVIACLLTCVCLVPVITEHDFAFSVTYTLDGETKTLEGIYRCEYSYSEGGIDLANRFYQGYFLTDTPSNHPDAYTIAQKDDLELCIVLTLSSYCLMGDASEDDAHEDPYLAVYTNSGMDCGTTEDVEAFHAEIVDWEYPETIENSFVFGGFSLMHEGSMLAMTLVALMAIFACIIFVKKEDSVTYKALDRVSVAFNFLIGLAAIPLISLIVALLQLTMSGEEFIYQLFVCIPALSAFSIAASIALRRKGFTKIGFFLQFVGPAFFFLYVIVESVIYNLFY